ncbi:MAG: ketoacid-CoA transferase [Deltaproteobacteria bacterium]|nr:ketoacid-CoA transferase [Deltaproteobacteria bacterium]
MPKKENSSAPYTLKEMMTIAAAREIRNGEIVFCGTGIAMLAAMAAKHISAPESTIFFETGAIDAILEEVPLAVADSRVMFAAARNGGLAEAFATMQNPLTGRRVVGILGAAQIDPYGNLNSTCLGDYRKPRTRFSGSGGACDVASFVNRTIIFMQHEKRKFVEKLDYLTSPGWIDGPEGRSRLGLGGSGPAAVITDLGIMRFKPETKRMYLAAAYPGITPEMVQDKTGFTLEPEPSALFAPPTPTELSILRERCDPQRLILD